MFLIWDLCFWFCGLMVQGVLFVDLDFGLVVLVCVVGVLCLVLSVVSWFEFACFGFVFFGFVCWVCWFWLVWFVWFELLILVIWCGVLRLCFDWCLFDCLLGGWRVWFGIALWFALLVWCFVLDDLFGLFSLGVCVAVLSIWVYRFAVFVVWFVSNTRVLVMLMLLVVSFECSYQ